MHQTPAERIIGQLDAVPTLPSVVVRILEIVLDAGSSAKDAGKVIEKDQALTAKVLRIVNSPAYGFRGKITSVQHAIALLGFGSLRTIVLSVSVFASLLDRHKSSGLAKVPYWQHCLATAAASRAIARLTSKAPPEDAYLAGLLHDIGKVVIDRNAPAEYLALAGRLEREPVEGVVLEQELLGTDHAQVGALLLERWHLPPSICQAVRLHHALGAAPRVELPAGAERVAEIVAAADFVAWSRGMGSVNALRPPRLEGHVHSRLEFDRIDPDAIHQEIDLELTRTAEVFQLPMPDAQTMRRALERANEEIGRVDMLYDAARRQLDVRVKELTELNGAIRSARQTLDPAEVRSTIVGVVHSGLGFDRAAYFAVDWESRWIAGREVRDSSQMEPRSAEIFFAMESDDNFLARCALEQGPFVVGAGQERGLAARLLQYFDVRELVASPIFSRTYLTGLVLADNAFSGASIQAGALETLGILVAEAGLALENALLFEKMREMAIRDEVTGLYNRRHMMEALTYEMERARRYGRPLTVARLEVGQVQTIRDTFGPAAGDRVLKSLAAVIEESSRDVDISGHYGGEEFLVLLPETSIEHALRYAERLNAAVQSRSDALQTDYPEHPLGLSIGLADYLYSRDRTRDSLMKRGEQALGAARQGGGNRVVVAADAQVRVNG